MLMCCRGGSVERELAHRHVLCALIVCVRVCDMSGDDLGICC